MERLLLTATRRAHTGTRPVRRMRQDGWIPAVVYGKATEPIAVAVRRQEFAHLLRAGVSEHGLITLRLDSGPSETNQMTQAKTQAAGAGRWEKPVLIKHVEHDPVDSGVLHIDFQAIALTEQIRIKIPVVLNGTPLGVKQDGGVLEHFLREIEVECLPTEIPKQLEYDVSAMKIGDTVHVRELAVPSGAKVVTDAEGAVASVLAPKEEKIAAPAEAVAEPEVIREKKPEAEEAAAEKAPEEKAQEKPEKPEKEKKEKG